MYGISPVKDKLSLEVSNDEDFQTLVFQVYNDPKLRDRLAISADQVAKIKATLPSRDAFEKEVEILLESGEHPFESKEERRKIMRLATKRISKRTFDEIRFILLPHQVNAIEQAALSRIKDSNGELGLLSSLYVRKKLDIDAAQFELLKNTAQEEFDALELEIVRLRQEAVEKVRKQLSKKQRKKLKELLGEQ